MNPRLRRSTVLLSLCLLLVASTGCLGVGGNEDLPEESTVADSLRSIEAIEATTTMEMQIGNESTAIEMDFLQRMESGEFRATMRQSDPDVTYRMVSNGSTIWLYNRSAGTVSTLRMDGVTTRWNRSVESMSGVFAALKRSDDEDVSVSPLPVVPGGGSAVGVASVPSVGEVSLTYAGTETAAGRTTHVVDLAPAGNDSLVRNGTLWFDAERYFPIKQRFEMSVGGQLVAVTMAYRNVTYNPETSEGAFTFEAPPNATVTGNSESVSAYESRDGLRAAAEQSVPDPDLPDGYAFAQATRVASGGNHSLSIQYSDGNRTVVASKRSVAGGDLPDGEAVDVAGNEGVYRETDTTASLTWDCNGHRYAVTGEFSKERLQDVATSMACE